MITMMFNVHVHACPTSTTFPCFSSTYPLLLILLYNGVHFGSQMLVSFVSSYLFVRLFSALVTSLDSFLYLEANYGLTATLLALQRKNQLDSGFVFIQLWCSALVTVLSYGLCIYVATDPLRTCNTHISCSRRGWLYMHCT